MAAKVGVLGVLIRFCFSRATLLMLPSTAVRLEDGTPVAWAFMGELRCHLDRLLS
jgi:hypothetical protein